MDASPPGGSTPPSNPTRSLRRRLLEAGAACLVYLLFFCLYTFPAITQITTKFFTDPGDGYTYVWSMWWLDKALHEGLNPYFTPYLHYPAGTTLVSHALTPFAGLLGIPLRAAFGQAVAFNLNVIFCFVVAGLTAYLLATKITGRPVAGLVAGFVFTFSSYHFAHAEGHLNLVSTQWIPLFLLAWWSLLERPTALKALGAAFVLLLVALCDYYYLFYCVLAGFLLVVWRFARTWRALFTRPYLTSLVVFVVASLAFVGPLALAVLRSNASDPWVGAHEPDDYSMDLLSPFVYGGHWKFASLTKFFWSKLPANIHETSVHLGFSVLWLAGIAFFRKDSDRKAWRPWFFLALVFLFFSLGEHLQVAGRFVPHVPGPYGILTTLVPPLELAGAPIRMVVITYLGLGILAGIGFSLLLQSRAIGLAAFLAAGLVLEYWPTRIPLTPVESPAFLSALKEADRSSALLDVDGSLGKTAPLYHQTIHEMPVVYGHISRLTKSVLTNDVRVRDLAKAGRFRDLCENYGIRYLVFREKYPIPASLPPEAFWFVDVGRKFFDVGRAGWNCTPEPARFGTAPIAPPPARPADSCYVDLLNGVPRARWVASGFDTGRAGPLEITGWAVDPSTESAPKEVFVVLAGPAGTFDVKADRTQRPDVAAAFDNENYVESGFRLKAQAADVPPGEYDVRIEMRMRSETESCDPKVKIRVR